MNAHTNHPHTSEHKVFVESGKKTRHNKRKHAQREKNTNLYPIPYTTWKKREKKATATIFVACVHFQSYGARPHYHQPSLPPPLPPPVTFKHSGPNHTRSCLSAQPPSKNQLPRTYLILYSTITRPLPNSHLQCSSIQSSAATRYQFLGAFLRLRTNLPSKLWANSLMTFTIRPNHWTHSYNKLRCASKTETYVKESV